MICLRPLVGVVWTLVLAATLVACTGVSSNSKQETTPTASPIQTSTPVVIETPPPVPSFPPTPFATASPVPTQNPTPEPSPTSTAIAPTNIPRPALTPLPDNLTFKDYRNIFKSDVIVVVGDKATPVEITEAKHLSLSLFQASISNFTQKAPVVAETQVSEDDERSTNLCLVGVAGSNGLLEQIWALGRATRVTADYPGPGKGLIQILHNPWNPQRAMLIVAGSDEAGLTSARETLLYGLFFSDKSIWVADMLSNPGNITVDLYRLYQDHIMLGAKTFQMYEDLVINLDNMTVVMRTTRELTSEEIQELESKGIVVEIIRPSPPAYYLRLPITVVPQVARYPFVKEISLEAGRPRFNLEVSTQQIQADAIWTDSYNGSGVTVAVIDCSGVDADNPFVKDRIVAQWDYTDSDNVAQPINGPEKDHGTHVVGIIAANPILVTVSGNITETANVTPGTSASGVYRWGTLYETLDQQHQYKLNSDNDTDDSFPILVADTVDFGAYDTVYVDSDNNGSWTNDGTNWAKVHEWINMDTSDNTSPYSYWPITSIKSDGTSIEFGLKGVAPGADIKVLKPQLTTESIYQAILDAADDYAADVISMSMSFYDPGDRFDGSSELDEAVNIVYEDYGVVFVQSAANSGNDSCHKFGTATQSSTSSDNVSFDDSPGWDWVHLTWTNNLGEDNNLDLEIWQGGNLVAFSNQTSGRT